MHDRRRHEDLALHARDAWRADRCAVQHRPERRDLADDVGDTLHAADDLVHRLAGVSHEPRAAVEVREEEQYRNMREVLDKHPQVVDYAREAIRRAGITVREGPIRGGTDGSKLSFIGLPTPNIFAGEHNFHSRLEWVSVQDMEQAVDVIVNLARIWEERA